MNELSAISISVEMENNIIYLFYFLHLKIQFKQFDHSVISSSYNIPTNLKIIKLFLNYIEKN